MIENIIAWILEKIFFSDSMFGMIGVPIIGFVLFFALQLCFLKANKVVVKLVPIYMLLPWLLFFIVAGIYVSIKSGTWFWLYLMSMFMGLRILIFAFGDALAWILYSIYKKRKQKKLNV